MILSSFVIMCGLIPSQICLAENVEKNKIPQDFEQAKTLIIELITPLPDAVKQLYNDDVVPTFKKVGDYVVNVWNSNIKPITDDIIDKIKGFLGKEIENRKPQIEQEIEKEKQELQQEIKDEIPEIKETIWQKIKDIIN